MVDYCIFQHIHNVDDSHDQVVSNNRSLTEEPVEKNDSQFKDSSGSGYIMLGDNFDKNIRAKYLRLESHSNASLHLFHICAVKDRIDFSHLPRCQFTGCLPSPRNRAFALLPTLDDDIAHQKNFIVLGSRILASNMKFFKFTFDGVIQQHIKHNYSKEMATKSTVVSIVSYS